MISLLNDLEIASLNTNNPCHKYCVIDNDPLSSDAGRYIPRNERCDISDTKTECTACGPNYYLTEDYTCKKCSTSCPYGCAGTSGNCIGEERYPVIENCKNVTEDHMRCEICKEDYIVDENGMCTNILEPEGMTCEKTTKDGEKCMFCFDKTTSEYFVPNDYVCTHGVKTQGTSSTMILLIAFVIFFIF